MIIRDFSEDSVPRIKRPRPERERPIRSWASAVGVASSGPGQDARAANQDGARRRDHGDDPVVRGVIMGGRVVDEWIRQAQQTARMLSGTPANAGWADASGRMFRAASDLMAAWLSVVSSPLQNFSAPGTAWTGTPRAPGSSSHAEGSVPPAPEGSPATSNGEAAFPASSGPRVKVEVASKRPVEVTVDLHRPGVTQFRVLDLRPERGDGPRIEHPHLERWDTNGLRLRVVVPDKHPPGTYHAVVLDDAADCAIGSVTVRIPD